MSLTESPVLSRMRLACARACWFMYRNNRGAGKMASGNFVRYGLANDSKALGDVLKSGDLIGWRPVLITADMVGKTIAQFASVEVKREGWRPDGSSEYNAQVAWLQLVQSSGGYACITNDPADIDAAARFT